MEKVVSDNKYMKELQFTLMKALGWYFKHHKEKDCTQSVIAEKMYISKSRISQWIIPPDKVGEFTDSGFESEIRAKHKALIPLPKAREICTLMNTSIASVLAIYLMREEFNKFQGRISDVEKLKFLKSELSEKQGHAEEKAEIIHPSIPQTLPKMEDDPNIITNISNPKFGPWIGKLYCYFYSTSSEEIDLMQKGEKINQDEDNTVLEFDDSAEEDMYQELLSRATGEAIFCGILEINNYSDSQDGLCHVTLSFIPDVYGIKKKPKVYRGILSLSAKTNAVYCELIGENLGDKAYFITDNPDFSSENSKISCCMAMVLTYSSRVNHRRPCAERMLISQTPISPGTPEYEELKVNLRMNDKVIRIDEDGYSHLISSISDLDDPDLIAIRSAYPNFDSLKRGYGKTEQILHIEEDDVEKLANSLNDSQQIKFKRLLRLYSLAPFYAKTKATKTEDLLRERCAIRVVR